MKLRTQISTYLPKRKLKKRRKSPIGRRWEKQTWSPWHRKQLEFHRIWRSRETSKNSDTWDELLYWWIQNSNIQWIEAIQLPRYFRCTDKTCFHRRSQENGYWTQIENWIDNKRRLRVTRLWYDLTRLREVQWSCINRPRTLVRSQWWIFRTHNRPSRG